MIYEKSAAVDRLAAIDYPPSFDSDGTIHVRLVTLRIGCLRVISLITLRFQAKDVHELTRNSVPRIFSLWIGILFLR